MTNFFPFENLMTLYANSKTILDWILGWMIRANENSYITVSDSNTRVLVEAKSSH
jgi:hypothetical protein